MEMAEPDERARPEVLEVSVEGVGEDDGSGRLVDLDCRVIAVSGEFPRGGERGGHPAPSFMELNCRPKKLLMRVIAL